MSPTNSASGNAGSRLTKVKGLKLLKSPEEGGTKREYQEFLDKLENQTNSQASFFIILTKISPCFLQIGLIPLPLHPALFIMGNDILCWKNGEKWSENDRKVSFLLPSSTKRKIKKWTRTYFSNTAEKKALFFLRIVLKEWSVNNPIRFTANESTFRRCGQQCSKFGRWRTFSISSIPKVNTNIFFQHSSE